MTKLAEVAWAAGDKSGLRFTSHDGKFWLAAGYRPAALWNLESSERRHAYPPGNQRDFYFTQPITVYDVSMEMLKDPQVSLETIKKREILPAEVEMYETPALAEEAVGWVKDGRLKDLVPKFLKHSGEGWMYTFLREDPKRSLAYNLTDRHTNSHIEDKKADAQIEWLKSYLEAQKIPFKIENQFDERYPHLDAVKVV